MTLIACSAALRLVLAFGLRRAPASASRDTARRRARLRARRRASARARPGPGFPRCGSRRLRACASSARATTASVRCVTSSRTRARAAPWPPLTARNALVIAMVILAGSKPTTEPLRRMILYCAKRGSRTACDRTARLTHDQLPRRDSREGLVGGALAVCMGVSPVFLVAGRSNVGSAAGLAGVPRRWARRDGRSLDGGKLDGRMARCGRTGQFMKRVEGWRCGRRGLPRAVAGSSGTRPRDVRRSCCNRL